MLPCQGCAYRAAIPGNAHVRCTFDWARHDPQGLVDMFRGVTRASARWFRFPFAYDPVWGPDECAQRAAVRDDRKVAPPNPMSELLSLGLLG